MRSWQDNAHEFGALTKQGYGVRLAVLVACSVDTPGRARIPAVSRKATPEEFARESGVSEATVRRYLDKWDRMVAAGWDVDRTGYSPDEVDSILVTDEFVTEFDALGTAGKAGLTGKAADIANNHKAMTSAILADPRTEQAARAALAERDQERAVSAKAYGEKVRNDPDLKAVDARLAHQDAFDRTVILPLRAAIEGVRAASAGWDAYWEGSTGIQQSLAIETVIALQGEVGILSMYAENNQKVSE